MKSIVGVCGYFSSGSSAFVDIFPAEAARLWIYYMSLTKRKFLTT